MRWRPHSEAHILLHVVQQGPLAGGGVGGRGVMVLCSLIWGRSHSRRLIFRCLGLQQGLPIVRMECCIASGRPWYNPWHVCSAHLCSVGQWVVHTILYAGRGRRLDGILIARRSHLSCRCNRRSSTGIMLHLRRISTWVGLTLCHQRQY